MGSPRALQAAFSIVLSTVAFVGFAQAASARTLYTGNYVSGSVSALTIAADGSLAPVAGSPFAAVSSVGGLALSPDGSTLIALQDESPGSLTAFTVAQDGTLALKSGANPVTAGFPSHSTIDPTGRYVYASNSSGTAINRVISGFALAGASMPVSLGDPFPGGGINLRGVASSVDGRFVYLGHNSGPANVRGYSVGPDGRLTALSGSPFNLDVASAAAIAVTPDGSSLFVSDMGSETIVTAAIGADGALTKVGAAVPAGGVDPDYLALTPDGRFLLVASTAVAGRGVTVFAVGANGALTPTPGGLAALVSLPTGLAVTPDGRRAYVPLQAASDNIVGYSIDANGVLAALPGSPYSSGGNNDDFAEQTLAIAPNQPPVAVVSATPGKAGKVRFSTAGSTDSDGTVARYDWDFGDGTTLANGGASPLHTYSRDGEFTATVTETDDEGCSIGRVYTGQTALCNGGVSARATTAVKVDLTAPKVSKLKVPKRFVKGKGKSLTAGFTVSEAATATLAIERSQPGRRVKGKCVKPKRSNRAAKSCKRWTRKVSRRLSAKAGANSLTFGKGTTKALAPGRYRLSITAVDDAGNATAKPARKGFRVVKPKPKKKR